MGADVNHGGTIEARLPRLAPDGAKIYAKALERPALAGMEGILEKTRSEPLGMRFPVRAHPQLPDAVRVLRDSARKP